MQRIRLWMKVFLGVHIAAGASSFLLAPVALATAKGGKQHRRWGMVYLWSMGVVAATALPMALYRPVLFLALVAVFSFYLAFSGYRVTRLKELARGGSATPVDWIAAVDYVCRERLSGWVWSVSSGGGCRDSGSWRLCSGLSGCGLRLLRCGSLCESRRRRCSGGTRTWGT